MTGNLPVDLAELLPVLVAALGGAAIGVERQWSGHASGAAARFGGVRTFTLLGALAGIAARLWAGGASTLAAILVGGAAALVVAGYVAASRREVDATTEVAALVVLATGLVAGSGHFAPASAVIAVTALLLVEKSRLHSLVGRLDDEEVRAGARFAVLAAVVLPLLPTGPWGPLGGIRPREIWLLALLLSGLSFAGYVARRVIGDRLGDVVAGLLGGLVSSTSVALSFSRTSHEQGANRPALALGVIAASTVMFARLAIVASALAPDIGRAAVAMLAPPLLAGIAFTIAGLARPSTTDRVPPTSGNPLQLGAAIRMALLFQAVLLAVAWARDTWGDPGLLGSAALLGIGDVDALSISIARSGAETHVAALALAVGAISNTLVKLGIAVAAGAPGFRFRTGLGLATLAVVAIVAASLATGLLSLPG